MLCERLRAADLAADQELLLSTYQQHWRLHLTEGGVRVVAHGGAEQAPVSEGGSGLRPDAIASMVIGAHGAAGLEQRLPDCHLGRQREVLTALFPPLTADLVTLYLPT